MKNEFQEDPTYRICLREHYLTWIFWIIQSALMLSVFIGFGYNVDTDPLGFPMGVPGWYLIGAIIAIVSVPVYIWFVKNKYEDFPLD